MTQNMIKVNNVAIKTGAGKSKMLKKLTYVREMRILECFAEFSLA